MILGSPAFAEEVADIVQQADTPELAGFVPAHAQVVGVPARVVKEGVEPR